MLCPTLRSYWNFKVMHLDGGGPLPLPDNEEGWSSFSAQAEIVYYSEGRMLEFSIAVSGLQF